MFTFLKLVLLLLQTVSADDWWSISETRANGLRSQRDVSFNVTIEQITTVGVNLAQVVFNDYGYTQDSYKYITELLDSQIQTLVLDLYWNEKLMKFQLCPNTFPNTTSDFKNSAITQFDDGIICEIGLSVSSLITTIENFISLTNTNLLTNILTLVINIYEINNDDDPVFYDSSIVGSNNDTLSVILNNIIGDTLFTPDYLDLTRVIGLGYNATTGETDDVYGYPELYTFLFAEEFRLVPIIWKNFLSTNSTYYTYSNPNELLFTQQSINAQFDSTKHITLLSNDYYERASQPWRYVYDSDDDPYTADTIHTVINYGYSPIINHSLSSFDDVPTLLNYSLWSWGWNQPMNETVSKTVDSDEDGGSDSILDSINAYRCAAMNIEGIFSVQNCYEEFQIVCRNSSNPYGWILNKNNGTYFQASDDRCSDDWEFSVPKDAIQQQSLTNYLTNVGLTTNDYVWIDMNSIAVSDCWVTGGTYATCPYSKMDSSRHFVSMITPAAVFCFSVLAGMFLLRFRTVPVQDNRKHWRKLINQFTENEKEGVPS